MFEQPGGAADHPEPVLSVAQRLAVGLAGPGVGSVTAVAGLDPEQLSEDERLDLLIVLERNRSWLEAKQHRLLAVIDRDDQSTHGWAREQVMLALTETAGVAQRRLRTARTLAGELPATLDLLTSGALTSAQARLITETAWTLPAEAVPAFEALAVTKPGRIAPAGLRQALKRAALRVDPTSAQQRHSRAAADRCVRALSAEDGMAELRVLAPAPDIHAAWTRLDAAARLLPATDPRTRDQQRTDLFLDAILSGLPIDALPTAQGRSPNIDILISLSTLLGLDDAPAELAGYGAITAQQARDLAHHSTATWRRLVTDPTRTHLLDYGTTTYRPPPPLTAHITARDGHCAHPHCYRPAHRCDIDHIHPFEQGGPTNPANLAALCRRHHTGKTHGIFSYARNPDGTHTWRHGTRTHTTQPLLRWNTPPDIPPDPPPPTGTQPPPDTGPSDDTPPPDTGPSDDTPPPDTGPSDDIPPPDTGPSDDIH